jgi:hypothetical protein
VGGAGVKGFAAGCENSFSPEPLDNSTFLEIGHFRTRNRIACRKRPVSSPSVRKCPGNGRTSVGHFRTRIGHFRTSLYSPRELVSRGFRFVARAGGTRSQWTARWRANRLRVVSQAGRKSRGPWRERDSRLTSLFSPRRQTAYAHFSSCMDVGLVIYFSGLERRN